MRDRSATALHPTEDPRPRVSVAEPFVHVRRLSTCTEAAGTVKCQLGHKIETGADQAPEGVFAEWSWDGTRLIAQTDRYGFYPLFYFHQDSEICLSPSIFTLVARGGPTELDEAGLAVFLRLGYFIGEDTPFKALRVLPPGARLQWENGTLWLKGGYFLPKLWRPSRDEAIDNYIALFKAAIQKRLPQDSAFVLPLSGGRDSRHIALELCEIGCPPSLCVTVRNFPSSPDQQPTVASWVAAALGVKHFIVEQTASVFTAEFRKNIATNLCADEHAWLIALTTYLHGRVATTYDGIGGDALSGSPVTPRQARELTDQRRLFESGRFHELADQLLANVDSALTRLLAPEALSKMSRDVARRHLMLELEQHANAPNPMGSFWFWTRTRREIALSPYGILRAVPTVHSPFLDHALYDFLASLPPELAWETDLHTEAIRRAYPKFSDIPYSRAVPAATFDHAASFGHDLALFALPRRPSRVFRSAFLMPLLSGCLLSRRYRQRIDWFLPLALYILQLEALVSRCRGWELPPPCAEPTALPNAGGSG